MNTEKGVRTVTVINLFLLLLLSPFICIEIYARQIMPAPILIARCLEASSIEQNAQSAITIVNEKISEKTKGKGLRA